jgi:hypothetical protein
MKMSLETVKPLGHIMVESGILSEQDQLRLDNRLEEMKTSGQKGYAGKVLLALDPKAINQLTGAPISPEEVDKSLSEQVTQKAEAAVLDLQRLAKTGAPEEEPIYWLKANWGNSGINMAAENPTRAEGVAAAANIAQNMVMLVVQLSKTDVDAARELATKLKPAVSAAANLARGILDGDSTVTPLVKKGDEWSATMIKGLERAVEATKAEPLIDNWAGNETPLQKFIEERSKEVEAGKALAVTASTQRVTERY